MPGPRRSRDPDGEARALTPFGRRVRALRAARGLQLKHMAAHLGVSSAYLSALERGERGRPTFTLVQGTIHYFGVIWDEADELQRLAELSDPAPRVPAAGCGPDAVLLANRLAREIAGLDEPAIAAMLALLDHGHLPDRGHPAEPGDAAGTPAVDGSGPNGSNPGNSPPADPSPGDGRP